MKTLRKKSSQLKKSKNPNPICFEKLQGSCNILIQVNESNIELLQSLQQLSCQKFEVGDYIVNNAAGWGKYEAHIFDKNLQPKSFKNGNYKYPLNEDGTVIEERFKTPKKLYFREIKSDDDLNTAIMFNIDIRKGYYIVRNSFEYEILSPKEFNQRFEILPF